MKRSWILGLTVMVACFRYTPPAAVPVRQATAIAAPFDSTWSAVITFFAENNIPIRTIEKASGIIVAEPSRFAMQNRTPLLGSNGKQKRDLGGMKLQSPPIYADCGVTKGLPPADPATAIYNVRVQGDGARSSVQVNVKYTGFQANNPGTGDAICVSTGKFETDLESFVKRRALFSSPPA